MLILERAILAPNVLHPTAPLSLHGHGNPTGEPKGESPPKTNADPSPEQRSEEWGTPEVTPLISQRKEGTVPSPSGRSRVPRSLPAPGAWGAAGGGGLGRGGGRAAAAV